MKRYRGKKKYFVLGEEVDLRYNGSQINSKKNMSLKEYCKYIKNNKKFKFITLT